jgi:tetratricopeptide (TPR) repeat protein
LVRRERDAGEAVEAFERVVEADPDSAIALAGLAEAQRFYARRAPDRGVWVSRAAQSAARAERRNPDLAAVHRIRGMLDFDSSRYENAEAEFRRAIEIDPGNGDAYRQLGQVCQKRDQLDEAIAALRKAIEVDGSDYRNHSQLGTLYLMRSEYSTAEPAFRKALELVPDEPLAHYRMASVYESEGKYAQSQEELLNSLKLKSTPEAIELSGHVLLYERREGDAVPYFEQARALSPHEYWPWVHLGICYRRLGEASKAQEANRHALALIQDAVAKAPRDGTAHAYLAYVCAMMGEALRAESEVDVALGLTQNDDTRGVAVWTFEALGKRDATLRLLSRTPPEQIADLSRWPDLDALQHDPAFQQLLAARQAR